MALPLLSTVHVNLNCSELSRSLAFYRDTVGLAALSHTRPVPQDGRGFGLPGRVQWDAHLMHDARGISGPAVDLLEWQQPRPRGRPAQTANQLGPYRLCLSHPDLDALHARLVASGVPTAAPPARMQLSDELAVRFLCTFDPDGACVEFIEREGALQLLHVNVNCRDLERSSDWYRRVLGLERLMPRVEPGPLDGGGLGLDGVCRFRADFLALPGQPDLVIDLLEWLEPRPVGRPPAAANQLGWFRLAWLVEDAASCCAELDRLGVPHSGPCWLDMGPEIPIAGLNAVFFRDPDGTCLELIERPRLDA